ncbi:MAG: glutathione S-transferase [Rhizobiales bacterium NRL2]|mgnify:CR=1 FL=1|jgi:glutathione S-transferase|nr:MAG: glutathione S-transferase [Rhizobiales bacterium NRL2]
MLLYEHPLSSYAQKVKIALREKGVAFDREVPEVLGSGRSGGRFAEASPRLEVPTLIDGDFSVFDSTIILEYLEDRFPEPPLLPADPAARAEARMIEDVCDTLYEAVNWGIGEIVWFRRAEGEKREAMLATAARQTAELHRWLAGKLGGMRWFGGENFGWADLSVAPYFNRSFHWELGDWRDGPLAEWRARLAERPSVQATFAEFDQAASAMEGAPGRLESGTIRREYRDHRLEWMMKSGGIDIVLAGLEKGNIRFTWPLGETG